jgi:hypothetical protein
MGHSSINVSLTYLRGLEVAELTKEDAYGLGFTGAVLDFLLNQ